MTHLAWPWVSALLALALAALLVGWSRRRRAPRGTLAAHTERLRGLPRYRTLLRREALTSALAAAGALLTAVAAVLIAGRPSVVIRDESELRGRDVMLCLDSSASMDPVNREVIGSFTALVSDLDGERVGLTIFSGASVVALPLTDDYGSVLVELARAEAAFEGRGLAFFDGTDVRGPRASQPGDGLVGCLERFDTHAASRGRAVVLATDNDPEGAPLFTLDEAAGEARRRDVVVHGIAPSTLTRDPDRTGELRQAVESTGGSLFALTSRDGDGADGVVQEIQAIEQARLRRRLTSSVRDDPVVPIGGAVAGGCLLVLAAAVRRRG